MKQYLIETDHLTKQYGEQKECFGSQHSCKKRGVSTGFGRNTGAGKTTTMKMLLGLTKPTYPDR